MHVELIVHDVHRAGDDEVLVGQPRIELRERDGRRDAVIVVRADLIADADDPLPRAGGAGVLALDVGAQLAEPGLIVRIGRADDVIGLALHPSHRGQAVGRAERHAEADVCGKPPRTAPIRAGSAEICKPPWPGAETRMRWPLFCGAPSRRP